MDALGPKKTPERDSTDRSLNEERDRSDSEITKEREAIEESATMVLQRARRRADGVLRSARDAADDHPGDRSGSRKGVAEARLRDDQTLRADRATEDDVLQAAREARRRALAALLGVEREQTDLHLLTERGRADHAITTRDTFLGMVSHDLRTMLTSIAMTAALIAREVAGDAPKTTIAARAESIQRLSSRMNRLIGDLVDVAIIESGRPLVSPEERDPIALVRESEEAFQPIAAAHGVLLTSEILGRPPLARFDYDRILQVLANLVGNAIKFTGPDGRVSLRVEPEPGAIKFSVSDDGSGIPEDKLESIFERFSQAGRHDRRGLGLGLYISRHIVEGHGGRIWAESSPGAGTKVSFTLPQA